MSITAYGWLGHIVVSKYEMEGSNEHNVVAIPDDVFNLLNDARANCKLDSRIMAELIGVEDAGKAVFLAVGTGFSKGFRYYGTVFMEAEIQSQCQPLYVDHDAEYHSAMLELYGLDLPPSRLMIGCSSEH
jgi:hypothetical protein